MGSYNHYSKRINEKHLFSTIKMNQDYAKDPATSEKVAPQSEPADAVAQGDM